MIERPSVSVSPLFSLEQAIDFEKRQLLQQWKSSLIGLQRRDEALQAIEDSIRQQKEENLNLDNEISGIVKETKKEHERNSDLAAIHSKVRFVLP